MRIVISSGHGKYIRGASGEPVPPQLDEVDEARKVVERVAELWRTIGFEVQTFHDNTSHDQNTNLNTIVNYHNTHLQPHDLDVSIHFNAYDGSAHGTECLYVTQEKLAKQVADNIAAVGFTNRGPKKRTDLFFLNNTDEPAILVETCFCDNTADSNTYRSRFEDVCLAIAEAVADRDIPVGPELPPEEVEPPRWPDPRPPDTGERMTIAKGDTGPDVVDLQVSLGVLETDGDFGSITDTWVRAFQSACNISADGVVGPQTWEHVDELDRRVEEGDTGITEEKHRQITKLAYQSPLMDYSWPDRGRSPEGYIPGMALCFAAALESTDPAIGVMSKAAKGSPDLDALVWYEDEFRALGMNNSRTGDATLRHLFVMLIGLGMRESSGRYCTGRDMSADNVAPETVEAGLFQTSWNIAGADRNIPPMLDDYWNNPVGFLEDFKKEVTASSNDLSCYGKGDGARYQWLSRFCPLFHTLVTGVGLRTLRQHWGPINRKEVTLRREADELLKRVHELMSGGVV